MKVVSARAPGKILWLGGYSILEKPNPGFVTTVNAFSRVRITKSHDNIITINVPQLNLHAEGRIDVHTGMLDIKIGDKLVLLKTAIEISARYALEEGAELSGFGVETKNDDQFSYILTGDKVSKSGLGGSAAVTVAAVAGMLKLFGIDTDKDIVHKLAQTAHSLATGKVGSGFDIAAAAYGSIIYERYSTSILKGFTNEMDNTTLAKLIKSGWDYSAERFTMPSGFELLFANFVGESMVTTKAVGSVSTFKTKDPEKYLSVINRINEENVNAINALKKFDGNAEAKREFAEAFIAGRRYTKELGILSNTEIEPEDCTELIEQSEHNGAFVAKLPGAGGRDAIAALCDSTANRQKLSAFWSARKELSENRIGFYNEGFDVTEGIR